MNGKFTDRITQLPSSELIRLLKSLIEAKNRGFNGNDWQYIALEREMISRGIDFEVIVSKAYDEHSTKIMLENEAKVTKIIRANTSDELELIELKKIYTSYPDINPRGSNISSLFNIGSNDLNFAKIEGDSLDNSGIESGDVAVFDSNSIPLDGQLVLVSFYGDIFIKIFRIIQGIPWLYSSNPDYPNIELQNSDEYEILGVVIFTIKKSLL